MKNIKFKAYIKNLNWIFEVWTMAFLKDWIKILLKISESEEAITGRNYLIDWVDNILLWFTWLLDQEWKEIYEWDKVLYQNTLVCEVVNNKFEYALKCTWTLISSKNYSSMEWTKNIIWKHYNFSEVFLSPTTNEVEIIWNIYKN